MNQNFGKRPSAEFQDEHEHYDYSDSDNETEFEEEFEEEDAIQFWNEEEARAETLGRSGGGIGARGRLGSA